MNKLVVLTLDDPALPAETTTGTAAFTPLYITCVSQHPQLRTRGFCWSKVLLPTCPCWQQLSHSD